MPKYFQPNAAKFPVSPKRYVKRKLENEAPFLASGHFPTPGITVTRDSNGPYRGHTPSTGDRSVPVKGMGSFRGAMVEPANRAIQIESTYERAAAAILLANRYVKAIRDQVAVSYRGKDGKPKRPAFDFVVTFKNGRTLAIAVKPDRYRERSGIERTVAEVQEAMPGFAEQIEVWSEANLPRGAEYNAFLTLRSRQIAHAADIEALCSVALSLQAATTIVGLGRIAKVPLARAFAAAVTLIGDGVLMTKETGRITHGTAVRLAE